MNYQLTLDQLIDKEEYISPNSENIFFNTLDEFIADGGMDKKPTTIMVYKSLKKDLVHFQAQLDLELEFTLVNQNFYVQFTNFLIKSLDNSDNTVSKKIKNLKTFLRFAANKGLIVSDTFKDFKAKNIGAPKIALSNKEVAAINNLNLSLKKDLAIVRDVFLFGIFSGMKFTDIAKLTPKDIVNNKVMVYDYVHEQNWGVPLNNYASHILRKYAGSHATFCFPMVNPVFANKQIKDIAQMARISEEIEITISKNGQNIKIKRPKYELITLDTARFTYAILSMQAGMRPEVLMLILGQKSIDNILEYTLLHQNIKDMDVLDCWNKMVI